MEFPDAGIVPAEDLDAPPLLLQGAAEQADLLGDLVSWSLAHGIQSPVARDAYAAELAAADEHHANWLDRRVATRPTSVLTWSPPAPTYAEPDLDPVPPDPTQPAEVRLGEGEDYQHGSGPAEQFDRAHQVSPQGCERCPANPMWAFG